MDINEFLQRPQPEHKLDTITIILIIVGIIGVIVAGSALGYFVYMH